MSMEAGGKDPIVDAPKRKEEGGLESREEGEQQLRGEGEQDPRVEGEQEMREVGGPESREEAEQEQREEPEADQQPRPEGQQVSEGGSRQMELVSLAVQCGWLLRNRYGMRRCFPDWCVRFQYHLLKM